MYKILVSEAHSDYVTTQYGVSTSGFLKNKKNIRRRLESLLQDFHPTHFTTRWGFARVAVAKAVVAEFPQDYLEAALAYAAEVAFRALLPPGSLGEEAA